MSLAKMTEVVEPFPHTHTLFPKKKSTRVGGGRDRGEGIFSTLFVCLSNQVPFFCRQKKGFPPAFGVGHRRSMGALINLDSRPFYATTFESTFPDNKKVLLYC